MYKIILNRIIYITIISGLFISNTQTLIQFVNFSYPVVIFSSIMLLVLISLTLKVKVIGFDKIFIVLLLRCIWLFILSQIIKNDGSQGRVFSSLIPVIIYFIINKNYYIHKHILAFSYLIILFSQLFFLNFIEFKQIGIAFSKVNIILPVGGSNYIASLVLFWFFLVINDDFKYKKIFVILCISTLILTFSVGGFFAFTITLLLNKKLPLKKTLLFIFLIIIILAYTNIPFLNEFIFERIKFLYVYDYNSFSSGRINLYIETLEKISNSFFIGYGPGYNWDMLNDSFAMRPHNLILESLIQGGIINLILFAYPIIKMLKVLKHSPVFYACISVLIHGMFEPNLQGINLDFIFYFFLITEYKKQIAQ